MSVHYKHPMKKITVSHGGTDYSVENFCPRLEVTQQENAVWSAEIELADKGRDLYDNHIGYNDPVKIYEWYSDEENYAASTLRFYGFIEDSSPQESALGETLLLRLRSYSRCLIDLKCKARYGVMTSNGLHDFDHILTDASNGIIATHTNHLLGNTANHTGYTLDTSDVLDVTGDIPYAEFPYKPIINCLDDLLDMNQASRAIASGSETGGAHWTVVPVEVAGVVTNYFILDLVPASGITHTSARWPTWWNTDQAGSTITVSRDMITQQFTKQRASANHIIYMGSYRFPADGDYLTNEAAGASALWGQGAGAYTCARTSTAAASVVGATSLLIEPNNAPNQGYAYYPTSKDLHLNIEAISSPANIPKLIFYQQVNYVENPASQSLLTLAKDEETVIGGATDEYYQMNVDLDAVADTNQQNQWIRYEIPIGPYWMMDPSLEAKTNATQFVWSAGADVAAGGCWDDINFIIIGAGNVNANNKYIDGLEIKGSLVRSARRLVQDNLAANANAGQKDVTVTNGEDFAVGNNVTLYDTTPDTETAVIASIAGDVLTMSANLANNYTVAASAWCRVDEYYNTRIITDQVGKDDSLQASDDSGTLAKVAYAELLRSARTPITGEITIPGKPKILPGQKCHIHAAKTVTGTYRIDKDMRITQHRLSFSDQGLWSTLTLTDDLINARPSSPATPSSMYSLIRRAADIQYQNRQITSVKAWATDIDQVILEKTYAFSSAY